MAEDKTLQPLVVEEDKTPQPIPEVIPEVVEDSGEGVVRIPPTPFEKREQPTPFSQDRDRAQNTVRDTIAPPKKDTDKE